MSTTQAVGSLEEAADLCAGGMLSVDEAAAFARLSKAELYARMARGELLFVKDGRRRTVPKRALVAHLAGKLIATKQAGVVSAHVADTGRG